MIKVLHSSAVRAGLYAALSVVALFGCAEDASTQLDDIASTEANLVARWVTCAKQGEFCAFSGTRQVRYGTLDPYVVKTFTGGVACDGGTFGTRRNSYAGCAFDANSGTQGAAGMSGMPMAGSSAMPGMPMAGSSAMPGMPMGAAGSGAAGTMSGMPMAGTAAMGPTIDMTALLHGGPGSSTTDIQATTEQPGASDGTGAFRTTCDLSHMSKDDPLVFPGQPGAAHLHSFFGNVKTDAYSTAASLRTTGNSTCRGGIANRSAYWVPTLVDRAGKPVMPERMDVYYKSGYNGIAASAIQPFPSGLRVLAGNPKANTAQEHAYWGCRDHYIGHLGSIPSCGAGDGVIMSVELPQCWDGVNLDSTDHRSHMAYPLNGKCPATHPVPIPQISFNVRYPVGSADGLRLSSDMYDAALPGGLSAHADWMESWDPAVSKTFITRCVNPAVDCHSHLLGDGRRIF